VNLFGHSYGTNLALTYLDEYGDQGNLRSLILDGVAPPSRPLVVRAAAINARTPSSYLRRLCRRLSACSQAFPDAEQHFYRLLERLQQIPAALTVEDTGNVPVVVTTTTV